jgi:hypothetical protein
VAKRAVGRAALVVVLVPRHSRRGRQYQHDQQDRKDDTPNLRWGRHCEKFLKTVYILDPATVINDAGALPQESGIPPASGFI